LGIRGIPRTRAREIELKFKKGFVVGGDQILRGGRGREVAFVSPSMKEGQRQALK